MGGQRTYLLNALRMREIIGAGGVTLAACALGAPTPINQSPISQQGLSAHDAVGGAFSHERALGARSHADERVSLGKAVRAHTFVRVDLNWSAFKDPSVCHH